MPPRADVGLIYKRLFNHRPVIQNEVHLFTKEFEVSMYHVALAHVINRSLNTRDAL